MSYQALARKWRPTAFGDVVGQEHVVRAIGNALDGGRLHHAYLFTGTRGVGKTTLARILAKAFNCERGVSSSPCQRCGPCREIDEGRFDDLLELDAASHTGVDNMREILENAWYAPGRGRYRVFIIDEVHMLSRAAFNSMLKTLEEPPEHVKFILATTDPQKVPVTILSRCLQFGLRHLTPAIIGARLAHIVAAEDIDAEDDALRIIADAAAGSMRDGLSLLDQAVAHGSGAVRTEEVRQMLGTLDRGQVLGLLRLLAAADAAGLVEAGRQLAATGAPLDTALAHLTRLLSDIAVAQLAPGALEPSPEEADIRALAGSWSAEEVQLYYEIAAQGHAGLALAPDPQAGLVMTLLRLLAFRPAASLPPPGELRTPPATAAAPPHSAVAAPAPTLPAPLKAAPAITAASSAIPPAAGPLPAAGGHEAANDRHADDNAAQHARAAGAAPPSPGAGGTGSANADAGKPSPRTSPPPAVPPIDSTAWHAFVDSLGGMEGALAARGEPVTEADGILDLRFAPEDRTTVQQGNGLARVQALASAWFGRPLRLVPTYDGTVTDSPRQRRQRRQQQRRQAARSALLADPFVSTLVEQCGATVVESSITAPEEPAANDAPARRELSRSRPDDTGEMTA